MALEAELDKLTDVCVQDEKVSNSCLNVASKCILLNLRYETGF